MLKTFECEKCRATLWFAKEGGGYCPEYSCEAVGDLVQLPEGGVPAVQHHLEIRWNHDTSDCENCGSTDSDGAKAILDGTVIFDTHANAGCRSLVMVDRLDILKVALDHLGILVSETEDASAEIPQGLHIVWEYLEGLNAKQEKAWSHGARAWLNGVLLYDKPGNLETSAYASHEDIFGAALFALGIAITEEDDGYVIFGNNGKVSFGPRPEDDLDDEMGSD